MSESSGFDMEKLEGWGLKSLMVGGALVILGFVFPRVFSADIIWPMENEKAMASAGSRYHNLSHEYGKAIGTRGEAEVKKKMEAARAEYESYEAKLDGARSRTSLLANMLHYVGLFVCVGGVFCYILGRRHDS